MAGIPTANILQPGSISATRADRALISQLQLLTPQYSKQYVEKYGNEDFTWWLNMYAGMERVANREFFWYESRGKLMPGITTASSATSTSGSTITLTLAAADHYNSGTQTPLRVGETLRTAAGNVEFEILTIPVTTPNAFQFTLRPKLATTTVTIASGDVLLFGGAMDVGEASGSINPLVHLDEKYTNTITEMRESWSATDLAEKAEVFYNSGVTGDALAGAQQAGTGYFTYKGLVKSNTRFKNNVEFKLMRGGAVTNTGLGSTTSVGTQGFIPKVVADGEAVGYTAGTLDIAKLHEITRIMDVNGSTSENMWLQDIYQRQAFSDGIFQQFPAGAWVWGKNENSEEAAITYGVQSIRIDGYLFKVKKYRNFNSEFTTGKTPGVDAFRDYGIICPQGETRDSKDASKVYKNVTVMYQDPPSGGTVGNGIRVWQHGGGSKNPTNGTMEDKVEMITYRGLRVVAANQFMIVQAV
jgi:hypothetical protein